MQKTCPITRIMTILSKKWSLLILKELSENKKNFTQLKDALNDISTTTLSARLKELEKEGIISSENIRQIPPKHEYFLTQKGKELIKCFDYLAKWSKKYQ